MITKLSRILLVLLALLIAPSMAFAEKTYFRKDLDDTAMRLEESFKKRAVPANGKTARQLVTDGLELVRKDKYKALDYLGAAVLKAPNDPDIWFSLSRAAQAMKASGWQENNQFKGYARAAAYRSYHVAKKPEDEARALFWLGELYAAESLWRPAINSYSASFKAYQTPEARSKYEQLLEKHGFRYLDYSVNSDLATPRVCFRFSEDLQIGKVDYAPFVATTGVSNPAILVEGRELCVEGVQHGQNYNFILRQGLPSTVDEVLRKPVDLTITVSHRSPQVRVLGRSYVLPTTGQDGLPLVTVNTAQVDVEVYRIGDRNIVPAVRSDNFLQQLTGYSIKDISQNKGVKVWNGTLDTKSDINQDVVTTFPVVEALGKLEPGIYVLTAEPHKDKKEKESASTDDEYDDSYYEQKATQWFVVSDIGLTAFKGKDGIHVLARSLSSAEPITSGEVRLLARNNDILATKSLDALGHAGFDPGLSRGTDGLEPGLIVISTGSDYNFIDLKQSAFDLSDRGVKGPPASGPVDVYAFAERGVYRPLETVHITALLRDGQGRSIEQLPLTAVVRRPDGVEFRRVQIADQGLGGRTMDITLPGDAPHGTWRVAFYTDPKGEPVGATSFLLEDYVAERLELDLSSENKFLAPEENAVIDLSVRYLFGAPATDLKVTGQMTLQKAAESPFPALKGFQTGIEEEQFQVINSELEKEFWTNETGKAKISFTTPDVTTALPAELKMSLSVSEDGGRAVMRSISFPVRPKGPVIGIRKKFTDLEENQPAGFEVVVVDAEGRMQAASNIDWTLSKISKSYQWFNSDGRWNYEPVEKKTRVTTGRVTADGQVPVSFEAGVNWGTYRLEVSASDLGETAQSSITFTVGYSGDQTADTPDLLEVTIDKASYAAGDTMQVQLSPRFDGKATLAVVSDRIYDLQTVDVSKSGTAVKLAVKPEWGAGAYLVALAHRPLDTESKRLPGRALGLTWFQVDKDKRALDVKIEIPDRTLPARNLVVPVKVSGMAEGEDVYVTLAAVDVGILNLTGYESPNPTRYFFGQKQISTDILDLYGYLIDGMQGTRGAYRSGGDSLPSGFDALPPTEEPLALFSGIVKVGSDGIAQIPLDLPAFNGTGRLMAVAWSKDRVGSVSADLPIRDPVVTLVTLPRFLAIGDQARLFLQLDNVDGPAGDYSVNLTINGPLTVQANELQHSFKMKRGQKKTLSVPIAALGNGLATVNMALRSAGGSSAVEIDRVYKLGIVPGTLSTAKRIVREIKPKETVQLSADLVDDIIPTTGAVTVSISTMSELDIPGLLKGLDRYPYGCTEQTTSRAMPLLYFNDLSVQESMAADEGVEQRIRDSIERILTRQSSNGAFGYWSAGSSDYWLDAFVTDFLTRAREQKYAVPDKAFNLALDRLRNFVANTTNVEDNSMQLAYAAYVLARNGRPVMGDLRYLTDSKLSSFPSPLSRAQLAAALALLGDRGRAQSTFNSAMQALRDVAAKQKRYCYCFGSDLRDVAAMLALSTEVGIPAEQQTALAKEVARMVELRGNGGTSTQEKNWIILAAHALSKNASPIALQVNGADRTGPFYGIYRDTTLSAKAVSIVNNGEASIKAVINVLGNPLSPEPAVSQGYKIERKYYDMFGTEINPARVAQNTRLVTVLTVTEPVVRDAQLLVVDRLPAGFEIDNPNLVDGTSLKAFDWLNQVVTAQHTEYRDDKFVASFNRSEGQPKTFSVAYIVRAVTPGQFMHPPASAEDMYRPERFGRSAFGDVEVFTE